MAPAAKSKKSSTPKNTPTSKSKMTVEAPPPAPVVSDSEGDESDDGGVDEEGLERLMNALGDEGLDEFEQEQLESVLGGDEDEDDEVSSEDGDWVDEGLSDDESIGADSEDEDEDGENSADDEDEVEDEIALDDVDDSQSVDNDAVPRQKIEIDNHVR